MAGAADYRTLLDYLVYLRGSRIEHAQASMKMPPKFSPFSLPEETVSQSGNASPSTSLSFRPQGEILDLSHSLGMTTRSAKKPMAEELKIREARIRRWRIED